MNSPTDDANTPPSIFCDPRRARVAIAQLLSMAMLAASGGKSSDFAELIRHVGFVLELQPFAGSPADSVVAGATWDVRVFA
jgi:hypothetical protein